MARFRALGAPAASLLAALTTAACGGDAGSTAAVAGHLASPTNATARPHARPKAHPPRRSYPPYPSLLPSVRSALPTPFVPAVRWRGQTAVWVARSPAGIGLLSFNQRLVRLGLHSGTIDAGPTGWRLGSSVRGSERERLVAAFNGGFKLELGVGGFEANGRVGAPLKIGVGSVVTCERVYGHRFLAP